MKFISILLVSAAVIFAAIKWSTYTVNDTTKICDSATVITKKTYSVKDSLKDTTKVVKSDTGSVPKVKSDTTWNRKKKVK